MPGGVTKFLSEEDDVKSDCTIDASALDKYFKVVSGKDNDVESDKLYGQVKEWRTALEDPENRIVPYRACHEGEFIHQLAERVDKVVDAISNIPTNSAKENVSIVEKQDERIPRLKNLKGTLDSLAIGYWGVNRIYGRPKIINRFFPARNATEASMVYRRSAGKSFQGGNRVALYGWENAGAVNPELLSFFTGPIKFALNTLITSTSDTSKAEEAKFRTLTGNGGNLVININYPLFHSATKGTWALVEFSPKVATEVPVLNSPFELKSLFGNINLGFDANVSFRLGKSGWSLFAYCRPAYIIGSEAYLKALQLSDNFSLVQYSMGVDIPNIGKLAAIPPASSDQDALHTNKWQLSFQISPGDLIRN